MDRSNLWFGADGLGQLQVCKSLYSANSSKNPCLIVIRFLFSSKALGPFFYSYLSFKYLQISEAIVNDVGREVFRNGIQDPRRDNIVVSSLRAIQRCIQILINPCNMSITSRLLWIFNLSHIIMFCDIKLIILCSNFYISK